MTSTKPRTRALRATKCVSKKTAPVAAPDQIYPRLDPNAPAELQRIQLRTIANMVLSRGDLSLSDADSTDIIMAIEALGDPSASLGRLLWAANVISAFGAIATYEYMRAGQTAHARRAPRKRSELDLKIDAIVDDLLVSHDINKPKSIWREVCKRLGEDEDVSLHAIKRRLKRIKECAC
jgi:hypothetical protein